MLEKTLNEEITRRDGSHPIAAGNGTIELEVVRENLSPPGRAQSAAQETPLKIDWQTYAKLWQQRARDREAVGRLKPFLTPTLLKQREAELTEALPEKEKLAAVSELPLLLGELAHRFLEQWNFANNSSDFQAELKPFLDRWIAPDGQANRERLQRELEDILASFFASEVYRELRDAQILGREIPLLIPWKGAIMEGVIDLLYEKDGGLFLADYKTDRVERSELAEAASRYHHQVEIYSEAARRVLKRDIAGFKLIFLRLGEAVSA